MIKKQKQNRGIRPVVYLLLLNQCFLLTSVSASLLYYIYIYIRWRFCNRKEEKDKKTENDLSYKSTTDKKRAKYTQTIASLKETSAASTLDRIRLQIKLMLMISINS